MLFRKLLFILLVASGCTSKNIACFSDTTLLEEAKCIHSSWISSCYVDTLTRYKFTVWANNTQSRFPEFMFSFQSPVRDTLLNWWNYSPVLSEIRSNVIDNYELLRLFISGSIRFMDTRNFGKFLE